MRSVKITYPPMSLADAKAWQVAAYKLNGATGTFYLSDTVGGAGRGTVAGTPTIDGSGQTGQEIATTGWNTGDNVKAGDWISISDRLYTILEDATESSGDMTLTLWPQLGGGCGTGDSITYGGSARGIFRLEEFPSFNIDITRLQSGFTIMASEVVSSGLGYVPPAAIPFDLTSLEAWYDLDDEGVWADSHNGRDMGEVGTIQVESCVGPDNSPAARFPVSGTNYLVRSSHETWNEVSSAFTAIAWCKPSTMDIFDRPVLATGGNVGWMMYLKQSLLWARWYKPAMAGSYTKVSSAPVDEWHMVVMRWDGDKYYLQVDGITSIFDGLTDTGAWTHGTFPLAIGRSAEAPASFIYKGLIQRVSIWQRFLSSDELDTLYRGGLGYPYGSLIDTP